MNSQTTEDDDHFFTNIGNWIKPKECNSLDSSRSSWNEEIFQNALGNLDVLSTSDKSSESPVNERSGNSLFDARPAFHFSREMQTESETSFYSLNKSENLISIQDIRN
jgi:hypothetical protein